MIATKGDLPDWDETPHGSCKRLEWKLQEELLAAKQRIKELEAEVSDLRTHLKEALFWEEARIYCDPDTKTMWIDRDDVGIVMPLARAAGLRCEEIEKREYFEEEE